MNTRSTSIILFGIATLFLTGCRQQIIHCTGGSMRQIDVLFMWDRAPRAKVDGMNLNFFPLSPEGKFWIFDIAGRDGGRVELNEGRYRLIAVNNNLSGVIIDGYGTPGQFSARARISDGVARPTGMIYRGEVGTLDVNMCGVAYDTSSGDCKECPFSLVRCFPDSLSTIYNVTLRNVEGSEHVRSIAATLSGIAAEVNLVTLRRGSETCITSFPLSTADHHSTTFCGVTSGLGTPSGTPEFTLQVIATRTDGSKTYKSIDVTEQVVTSRYQHNVIIDVDHLKVPDTPVKPPDEGDLDINVGVDGWHEIVINYET